MKAEDIYARIQERLKAVGMNSTSASKAAGITHDAIRNIKRYAEENSGKLPTVRTLSKLAVPLQTTASWLMSGEGENNVVRVESPIAQNEQLGVTYIPVVGFVQAGAWMAIPDLSDPLDYIPYEASQYAERDLFALRVFGNSMNKYYPDGSVVVCVNAIAAGVREFDRVVLVRDDGTGKLETTLKEIVAGEHGFEFWPRSTDPAHQEPFIPPSTDDDSVGSWEVKGIVLASVIKSPPRKGRAIDIG